MTLTIDLDYKPKSLSRLMSKSIVKVFHKPLKVIKLWKSTYVTCAVTSMTPQSVIPTTALLPAPPLKIFPTIGVAHSAAWTNPISRSNNPSITKIVKAASLKKRSRFCLYGDRYFTTTFRWYSFPFSSITRNRYTPAGTDFRVRVALVV